MIWNDLREYLNKLDELGELQTVLGCDWQEEIGGITELITEETVRKITILTVGVLFVFSLLAAMLDVANASETQIRPDKSSPPKLNLEVMCISLL